MTQTGEKTRGRAVYLDVLRVLATYAVVVLHVASKQMGGDCVGVFVAWDGVVRWAVPMFVMISGSLFLRPEKHIAVKEMWTKYILRMVTAFLFWSAVYCIWEYFFNGLGTHEVKMYMITGYWHMWFIIMIVGLYMLTPIIRCISANRLMTKYFLLLAFIFTICIPTIRNAVVPYTCLAGREDRVVNRGV